MHSDNVRYCGRSFTVSQMEAIRALIADNPRASRLRLSQLVCQILDWRRLDGRLKDMSCRVAMLRMQDDGLIQLPPPRHGNNNGRPPYQVRGRLYHRRTPQAEPEVLPVAASAGDLLDLRLEMVSTRAQSHLWNEYIDRYHYLGY
ncbi:MAG: hypothetical protein AABZ71_06525, partial [Candidatus Binatota bacterium]